MDTKYEFNKFNTEIQEQPYEKKTAYYVNFAHAPYIHPNMEISDVYRPITSQILSDGLNPHFIMAQIRRYGWML